MEQGPQEAGPPTVKKRSGNRKKEPGRRERRLSEDEREQHAVWNREVCGLEVQVFNEGGGTRSEPASYLLARCGLIYDKVLRNAKYYSTGVPYYSTLPSEPLVPVAVKTREGRVSPVRRGRRARRTTTAESQARSVYSRELVVPSFYYSYTPRHPPLPPWHLGISMCWVSR